MEHTRNLFSHSLETSHPNPGVSLSQGLAEVVPLAFGSVTCSWLRYHVLGLTILFVCRYECFLPTTEPVGSSHQFHPFLNLSSSCCCHPRSKRVWEPLSHRGMRLWLYSRLDTQEAPARELCVSVVEKVKSAWDHTSALEPSLGLRTFSEAAEQRRIWQPLCTAIGVKCVPLLNRKGGQFLP